MGFRKNRRHRGGGGGGGGGGSHAHANDGRSWTGEANGLQPGDDVGNRKSFKPVIVPPDDLGNRRDPDEEEHIPDDNVGNRVDSSPTHEASGILLDMDPKKRRRRSKGAAPVERAGRWLVGGVNPLIAGGNQRPNQPPPEETFDDDPPPQQQQHAQQPRRALDAPKKRFEQVDGHAAQEVNERRAQRFFDFDEDDRFEYTLKTPAEAKRAEAERFVKDIVAEAGREAIVAARVIEDGDKPKLLVTIDDKGPSASLPAERRAANAADPLFVMGNAALMSLNYIVNKVVNRYPDDRIRLAVLPLNDERFYLESLDEHRRRGPSPVRTPPVLAEPVQQQIPPEAPAVEAAVLAEPSPVAVEVPAETLSAAPAKKATRKKSSKKSEEIIPPPASTPEPALAVVPEAPPEAAPRSRRRAPTLEEAPRPTPVGEESARPRPRVRRAATALVEVVRVPKKP